MSPSMPCTSVTLRDAPRAVRSRVSCTMTSIAEAICSRIARSGRSMPAISTIVSMRASASRGELAWIVESDPSWPVFIACSMSRLSAPRTSPTMMRSGRMRSELRTRSRMRDLAAALDVRRSRLEPHDVVLLQLQLGGVLDRDDALVAPG